MNSQQQEPTDEQKVKAKYPCAAAEYSRAIPSWEKDKVESPESWSIMNGGDTLGIGETEEAAWKHAASEW